ADRWIQLIMNCASSYEYKIGFNAEEEKKNTPVRGLRQGDSFSTHMF
uniref:Reverse transcriptase domain-containing protein n=1 Tax=Aegilops tauschii subsp. strangulata TaxID=200361 RepID=A0A452YZS3_AEGTS